MKRIISEFYDGKKTIIDPALIKQVGNLLENQVTDNFGAAFDTVDYTTPDAEMLVRLTRDVWQFSAAKNYQQLQDLTLLLKDENGNLRTFGEFKEIADRQNIKYNSTWMKTEWDSAVGSSIMASKWVDIKANEDIMPYLRFATAGDDRVRTEHQLLDGTVRKISDDFWNTHYPPIGWKCRCDAEQIATSTAKETERIPSINIPEMFQTNLANNGLIFPAKHPYYDGVPVDVLKNAIHYLPVNAPYRTVYGSGKGKTVKMHLLHGIDEMDRNIETAKILADNGYSVKLLPVLNERQDKLREKIYGIKQFNPGKNPNAIINGVIYDIKNPLVANKSCIHNAIESAQDQCDRVIIALPEVMEPNDIFRHVNGKLDQARYITDVWVINGDEILRFNAEKMGHSRKAKRPTR